MICARWTTLVMAAVCSQGSAQSTALQDDLSAAGPLLWYQFNEASGNLVNHGSLGSSFDAVATGAPQREIPAQSGDTAIGLSRGSWFESLGVSSLTGNPTFSIEAVIRLDSGGSAGTYGPFLHWGDGGPGSRTGREVYFSVQHTNNARLYSGFYNAGVRTVSNVAQDAWLHYVWVREGGNDSDAGSTLYINGVPVATELDSFLNPGFVAAANIAVQPSAFRINRAQDFGDNRYFTGSIDELALYDRSLTPEEITRRSKLISCVGDIANDFGSSGYDGQISFGDFLAMLGLVGPCPGGSPGCAGDIADDFGSLNGGDGMVSFGDFLALLGLVGPCP